MAKDLRFIQDAFKQSVYKTVPIKIAADAIIRDKMSRMSQSKWDKVLTYVNRLRFPLTIYRGLMINDKSNIDTSHIGVNWTIDKNLFRDKSSHFQDCNFIVEAQIKEEDVDWVETVQNYIYYSLEDVKGRYPETEVTIKESSNPNIIGIYDKSEFFKQQG